MSYNISMDYSYWYSYLNWTTYTAQSFLHPLYSVTLNTKGEMIFHLPTQAPYEAANHLNQMIHFILLS